MLIITEIIGKKKEMQRAESREMKERKEVKQGG